MSDLLLPADLEILLQFTDRSRHMTRIGKCPRAAFLSTAFGPSGYGITRRAKSVPLASGTMLHDAHEYILRAVMLNDQLPGDHIVREGIALAHATYDKTFVARGLQFWEAGDEALQRTVAEQKALIEAMIWVWVLYSLPRFHQIYKVVSIEEEEVAIYGCTCGLGDGVPPWEVHVERGCGGIGIQCKADWIGEHRENGTFAYHELKTTGAYPDSFAGKWETDIQPYLGAHGWEQRTGNTVSATFIHGFLKGQRKKEKAPGDYGKRYTGPEYQDSRLVYAYCRAAEPPVFPEADWQAEYDWVDEEGKNRRLGPKYKKTLTTFYPGGVEAWVRQLSPESAMSHLCIVGPLLPKPEIVAGTIKGWVQVEQDTRTKLWALADLLEQDNLQWYDPPAQDFIDQHFPQSWQCDRYSTRHRCEFAPICLKQSGWQDPLTFMDFIPRRPHHEPELLQMRQRGLEPPEDQGEEGED